MTIQPPQPTTSSSDSFLDETQLEGKAKGKIEIGSLDQAIAALHTNLDPEVLKKFQETKEEDLPTAKISIYCHDCDMLVPAKIGKTLRGKPRNICGKCDSKKISLGREEVLKKFYHLEK